MLKVKKSIVPKNINSEVEVKLNHFIYKKKKMMN